MTPAGANSLTRRVRRPLCTQLGEPNLVVDAKAACDGLCGRFVVRLDRIHVPLLSCPRVVIIPDPCAGRLSHDVVPRTDPETSCARQQGVWLVRHP